MLLKPTRSGRFGFQPVTEDEPYDIDAAWNSANADLLSELRSRHIGYVLQSGGLLPYLTVRENISLSRRLLHLETKEAADYWADRLNISAQLDKLPQKLSVGQRQRVAIARALAHEPTVVIADEPTASVDPVNAERIMELMVRLADDIGVTLIVASHAHELMQRVGLRMIEHEVDLGEGDSMHVTVSDVAS